MPNRKKPRRFTEGTKYVVVSRPCEDLVLDDKDHNDTMLVPAYEVTRSRNDDGLEEGEGKPNLTAVRFGEDVDDDCEDLFDEEGEEDELVESEIDEKFIQEMMAPDPNYTYTVYEELPQRRHGRRGLVEKQFENAMRQYQTDGQLEADDARVRGPIDLENDDPNGNTWNIDASTFTVMATGSQRVESNYKTDVKELAELTKEYLRQQREMEGRGGAEEDGEAFDVVQVPVKKDRWDCETILSTYSNLYNHPSVITPACNKAVQKRLRRRNVDDDEQRGGDVGDSTDLSYLPQPSPNETAEEKRERRRAVKELQRTRRQMKKVVKLTYRSEGIRQGLKDTRATMSLS